MSLKAKYFLTNPEEEKKKRLNLFKEHKYCFPDFGSNYSIANEATHNRSISKSELTFHINKND